MEPFGSTLIPRIRTAPRGRQTDTTNRAPPHALASIAPLLPRARRWDRAPRARPGCPGSRAEGSRLVFTRPGGEIWKSRAPSGCGMLRSVAPGVPPRASARTPRSAQRSPAARMFNRPRVPLLVLRAMRPCAPELLALTPPPFATLSDCASSRSSACRRRAAHVAVDHRSYASGRLNGRSAARCDGELASVVAARRDGCRRICEGRARSAGREERVRAAAVSPPAASPRNPEHSEPRPGAVTRDSSAQSTLGVVPSTHARERARHGTSAAIVAIRPYSVLSTRRSRSLSRSNSQRTTRSHMELVSARW